MTTITELPEDSDHHDPARYEPAPDGPDEGVDALGDADAVVDFSEDGIVAHYVAGRLHRIDGPALVIPDGTEEWYLDGHLHRTDGGPAVTTGDGSLYWYEHGRLHRTNGPAIMRSDGSREYYRHGELHRTDGPAISGPYVSVRWYLYGRRVSAHGRRFARARRANRPTPTWSPPPEPTLDYDPAPDEHLEAEYEDRTVEMEL
ncbi:MAG: hypothetical protein ACYDHU_10685 [Acidimicrobiales bacterium]